MKEENYIVIMGWMVNHLKLKSTDLIVYAIIYGFTQDGKTEFTGSLSYMMETLNCSRPTVTKSLNYLVDNGLIKKREKVINNVQFNRYKVDLGVVKKLYRGSKETLQGGSKETLHNISIKKNNIEKEEKKKLKKENLPKNKYLKLSNTLSDIIRSKRNVTHSAKILNNWAADFKKLHIIDGVPPKRQKEVLDWYKTHIGGEYIPVVQSGSSFREKIDKLEAAILKEQNTKPKRNNSTGYRGGYEVTTEYIQM